MKRSKAGQENRKFNEFPVIFPVLGESHGSRYEPAGTAALIDANYIAGLSEANPISAARFTWPVRWAGLIALNTSYAPVSATLKYRTGLRLDENTISWYVK